MEMYCVLKPFMYKAFPKDTRGVQANIDDELEASVFKPDDLANLVETGHLEKKMGFVKKMLGGDENKAIVPDYSEKESKNKSAK